MVRRTRIVACAAVATGIFWGAALAPAAGDRQTTGTSVTYTEDGIPVVKSGVECKGRHSGARKHDRGNAAGAGYDASDY